MGRGNKTQALSKGDSQADNINNLMIINDEEC